MLKIKWKFKINYFNIFLNKNNLKKYYIPYYQTNRQNKRYHDVMTSYLYSSQFKDKVKSAMT